MSSGIYNKYTGYHNRQSIRLPGYDYSQPGYYFVTLCIHDRTQRLFGDVVDGNMKLNQMGTIVGNEISVTGKMRTNVKIDEYVIMPNHVHAIISIIGGAYPAGAYCHSVGAYSNTPLLQNAKPNTSQPKRETNTHAQRNTPQQPNTPPNTFASPSKTIGSVIRGIKSTTAKQINVFRNMPGIPVWQRNYYDHIIRDDNSLFLIRKYIRDNPKQWCNDSENHIEREMGEFDMSESGGDEE